MAFLSGDTNSKALVQARDISKSYPLVSRRDARLRALGSLLLKHKPANSVCVLKSLDLEIRRGESTGIIGENGAGKSTLLKLLTGVLTPSTGTVEVNGSISALLELGTGFHPEYSGWENLRMAAALAGLGPAEMRTRLPEIIDFADIGRYIDEPIKHYSSGMVVRLGFAIVAAIRPDLLITDEVLAVGDESFQKKCVAWMEDYLANGGTLLLVSHGMYHIQKLCRQAIWLKNGEVAARGDVFDVTQAYLAYHERKSRRAEQSPASEALEYRIERLAVNDADGCEHLLLDGARKVRAEVDVQARDAQPPVLLFGVAHTNGMPIYGVSSEMEQVSPLRLGAGSYRFRFTLDLSMLLPGEYLLKLHPMDAHGLRLFETREIIVTLKGETRELGVVRLPHHWHEL